MAWLRILASDGKIVKKIARCGQWCKQLKSWWNVCTQTKGGRLFGKIHNKEAEAQELARRIHELADEELLQMARLLVSKPDREIFGDTEFELRDIVHKVGAEALEEHLRQKKTAIADAVQTARRAHKQPSFKLIAPNRR